MRFVLCQLAIWAPFAYPDRQVSGNKPNNRTHGHEKSCPCVELCMIFVEDSGRFHQFLDFGNDRFGLGDYFIAIELSVITAGRGDLPVKLLGRHCLLKAQAQAALVALDADDA